MDQFYISVYKEKRRKQDMKCLILAAGYATRLYPLTEDTPKPLLEVAGKSILERLLDKISVIEDVYKRQAITSGILPWTGGIIAVNYRYGAKPRTGSIGVK